MKRSESEKWRFVVTISLELFDEDGHVLRDTPDKWMFYPKSGIEADILMSELRDGIHMFQQAHVPGASVPYGRSHFRKRVPPPKEGRRRHD